MKDRKNYFYYIISTNSNDEIVWESHPWARQALVVAGHRWLDMSPEQKAGYVNYDEDGNRVSGSKMIFAVVSSDYNWEEEPDKAFNMEGVVKEWSDWWKEDRHRSHWAEGRRSRYGFPVL